MTACTLLTADRTTPSGTPPPSSRSVNAENAATRSSIRSHRPPTATHTRSTCPDSISARSRKARTARPDAGTLAMTAAAHLSTSDASPVSNDEICVS